MRRFGCSAKRPITKRWSSRSDIWAAMRLSLVVALAGGELEFTRRIVGVLPRMRAAKLQAAIDSLGPTRLSDVELAQEEVAHTARFLENSGRLAWLDGIAPGDATQGAANFRNSAQAA